MGLTEACVHEDLRNILASNWSLRRELQKPDKTQKVIERRNFWAKQFSYWSLDCSLMQSYVQNPREKRWNKKSWIACSLSLSLSLSLSHTHTHTHIHTCRKIWRHGQWYLRIHKQNAGKRGKSLSSLNKHQYCSSL